MRYLILLLVVVAGGLIYIRIEQPKTWNDGLAALKAEDNDATPSNVPTSAPATVALPQVIVPTAANVPTPTPVAQVANADSTGAQPNMNIGVATPKAFVPPDPLPAQPNWSWTVLGKVYSNVVVTKVEADCVHITYDGGIGSISQTDLPADLQKVFNYDPELAKQTEQDKAAERARIDAEQAPEIAALEAKEKAQAAEDEAQRVKNMGDQAASVKVSAAQDQKRQLEGDIAQMEAAHEISVYDDPKTGVHVGGAQFWVDKYNADAQAISQCDQIISSGGK